MRRRERRYIKEVLDYEDRYNETGSGCPPIVPKLLLSIFIRAGDILIILSAIAGLLLACLCK